MARVLFITGTDTGVGKTVVTCLLVAHLLDRGEDAVAIKPLCSGSRDDLRRLRKAQRERLTEEEICAFYFDPPITPLLAARRAGRSVSLAQAVSCVREMTQRHQWVLVEGAGGLLSPLGEGWSAADWIGKLRGADVVVVAPDRLGTINHTLLTMEALKRRGRDRVQVVLNAVEPRADESVGGNERVLGELLGRKLAGRVGDIGRVGRRGRVASVSADHVSVQELRRKQKNLKKVLARLIGSYTFSLVL